jgi:hypothetical protein
MVCGFHYQEVIGAYGFLGIKFRVSRTKEDKEASTRPQDFISGYAQINKEDALTAMSTFRFKICLVISTSGMHEQTLI